VNYVKKNYGKRIVELRAKRIMWNELYGKELSATEVLGRKL